MSACTSQMPILRNGQNYYLFCETGNFVDWAQFINTIMTDINYFQECPYANCTKFPVNIFGVVKLLKGNFLRRLKMMGMKTTIECFQNVLCKPCIKHLMTNVRKLYLTTLH